MFVQRNSTDRPRVSDDNVERIRDSFQRSPFKSTNRASRELEIPQTTVWHILRRHVSVKPYIVTVAGSKAH